AGELVHRLINLLAGEPESAQEVAHRQLGGLRIFMRPHGANDGLRAVERLQVLVVIAELDEMAELNRALVRLFLAEEDLEQGGLAAAVGSHDADALAALDAEGEIAEEGRVICLRQAIDLQDDIAGAADLAEVHARRVDPDGALDAFHAVELFLARGGLLM